MAGSLRTLAFKNEENKNIIVDLGSLPLLIQMLRSDDTTIHYEASCRAGQDGVGWDVAGLGRHTTCQRMHLAALQQHGRFRAGAAC